MSLLDDAGVAAGLEDLEPGQQRRPAASDPAFLSSVHDLDNGLPRLSPDESREFLDEPPVEEDLDEVSVDWKTLLRSHFGVWVLC